MEDSRNPYAAPRAPVADPGENQHTRPKLVWVITIFQAIGVAGSAYSAIAALLGSPLGGEAAAQFTKHLGALDHVATLVVTAISAIGTVLLFQLKRRALPLLVLAFGLGVGYFGLSIVLRPGYRAAFETFGYWGILMGWGINLLILLYVWRLARKGVLRG